MKAIRLMVVGVALVCVFFNMAMAEDINLETFGAQAIKAAMAKLKADPEKDDLACLTNAGYAIINGQSTRMLHDVLAKHTSISLGKGNLLPVHSALYDPLWLAFVHKKSDKELMLTYVAPSLNGVDATDPVNVYIAKDQSFKPFAKVLGRKAFAVVTLANGWADNIPDDLMAGSLYHDHLCCGVFSGYFTVRFILKNIPLGEGDGYMYIGAPAWCQDDYLMRALNLTPGKHGYYTMSYPWSRPWKTSEKVFDNLGGIVIRYNRAAKKGQAYVLRFNWRWDEFAAHIGQPGMKLDWGKQRWLHAWYNKFAMEHLDDPEYFVSIIKVQELKGDKGLNRLIKLGANPLETLLGPDDSWTAELKQP
jgi:formylmethanofuran dehydrogenase subunit E-like metal-binding protein